MIESPAQSGRFLLKFREVSVRFTASLKSKVLYIPWYGELFLAPVILAMLTICKYALPAFTPGGLIYTYDGLWYHLPAVLRYAHRLSFEYAPDSSYLLKGLSSPPLPHLAGALLVRLSGNIIAAEWPGFLLFLAYLWAIKKIYQKEINIGAAIVFVASVPLILLHLPLTSTDLWTNVLCSFSIIAADRLWHVPSTRWVAISCLSIVAVAYSKMTLLPTVAIVGIVSTAIIFIQCRNKRLPWMALVLYVVLGGTLAPLWLLHLWQTYGNVFFPYPNPFYLSEPSLPLDPGDSLSKDLGCWDAINISPAFINWPRPARFFVSFFELTRLMTHVLFNWRHDEGVYNLHRRMGGFNGVTMMVGTILVIAVARVDRKSRFIALLLLALVLQVSITMHSHELRYFMFIPLVMALITARAAARNDRLAVLTKAALLPIAFFSPLFLSSVYTYNPRGIDAVPPVYRAYWKGLDAYIAKNGRPARPFCMPDIGPEKMSRACEKGNNVLFSRALAAGLDMNTYNVAEWCVSNTPKLAPPYKALPPKTTKSLAKWAAVSHKAISASLLAK